MQPLTGFILVLVVVAPVLIFLLHKKTSKSASDQKCSARSSQEKVLNLIGELAHEIKNPLSTIKINLKLTAEQLDELERTCTDIQRSQAEHGFASARRKIAVIQKETDRLEQILNSFQRYADKTELQLAASDINDLVSDMVDFYSPQGHSHSITVRHSFYGHPLICNVDADVLKQAILNLFINAQQAMSDGGELIIKTDREKANAVIRISDTGSGIPADKLDRIFDAYYSSRPQGNGLGLPTAKKIVEAHKGIITVDSEQGKGTLFTIKMPLSAD